MKNIAKRTTAAATGAVRSLRERLGVASGNPGAPNRRDRRKARIVPDPSERVAPRTYEEARTRYATPSISLPSKRRVGAKPNEMLETMVRQLVARGMHLDHADTLADITAAFAKSQRPGPDPKGPRLFKRKNGRIYLIDGSGCTTHRESTRHWAIPGKNWRRHPGAVAYLADYVERKVQNLLHRVHAGGVTMPEIFVKFLTDIMPGENATDEEWNRYHDIAADCESLEEYFGDTLYRDLEGDAGLKYARFRTGEQIKTQSGDVEEDEVRRVQLITARGHVDTLVRIIAYHADLFGQAPKVIKKPKVPKQETLWLTADQWLRLFWACRGFVYDLDGKLIGYDRSMREKFEPVLKFVMFYTWGGTRHGNILELLWAMDLFRGHVDAARSEIKRQGSLSAVTTKRRGTSALIGSLRELAVTWCDRDAARRGKRRDRFVHVVHKLNGDPFSGYIYSLFREVRERAGLPWVRPHFLKHSGVTYCTLAGMSQRQVSIAFSTTMFTLERVYTHLREEWSKIGTTFDENRLLLRKLKGLTVLSAEAFYGGAVPLPPERRRGLSRRLPLARPMTPAMRKAYVKQVQGGGR